MCRISRHNDPTAKLSDDRVPAMEARAFAVIRPDFKQVPSFAFNLLIFSGGAVNVMSLVFTIMLSHVPSCVSSQLHFSALQTNPAARKSAYTVCPAILAAS